ncbi:MAG: hypothetical protein IK033_08075 [Verrucomicrobia bacterium]|nr:hypothetical protein [Verrucomicrobiota bacterium]
MMLAAALASLTFANAQTAAADLSGISGPVSIRQFNVLPENSAETNKINLQKAIDWAARRGAALYVEPAEEAYHVAGGIVLRQNASLIGAHGPTGRGTRHPDKRQPVGSVFKITDTNAAFITVENATQIRGIQFWYPEQTLRDPEKVIAYPPTIQVSQEKSVQGVTLSCLTFYGEYIAMDFNATAPRICEQILFEHCYGYPLSGEFIRIDRCYDIPRILHCHVNPSNERIFAGGFSRSVIDSVIKRKTFTYAINHTDNAQLMDVFTFGVYGGIYLGPATYGQLTNFNLDCVGVGIHKCGDSTFNRNWQIAQGSIIANVGDKLEDIHPIIIEGEGHTSFTNVEAFSGPNGAVTAIAKSQDFMLIRGDKKLTVSLYGARMRNYESENPLTILNKNAVVRATDCIDKNENPWEMR